MKDTHILALLLDNGWREPNHKAWEPSFWSMQGPKGVEVCWPTIEECLEQAVRVTIEAFKKDRSI